MELDIGSGEEHWRSGPGFGAVDFQFDSIHSIQFYSIAERNRSDEPNISSPSDYLPFCLSLARRRTATL
jgi:hypothetical protein